MTLSADGRRLRRFVAHVPWNLTITSAMGIERAVTGASTRLRSEDFHPHGGKGSGYIRQILTDSGDAPIVKPYGIMG